jgi:nucleoside-diphosphate-sugar epimerase
MRVLVTGADGFIGGHLVRGLTAVGHDVTSVVFMRPARAKEVRIDLTRKAELVALPGDIEAIVHAAGLVDARASMARMTEVNVEATRGLVQWAKARNVRHFVQLSSVAVYGPLLLGEDRTEDTTRMGMAVGLPYMRTKARAERLVEQSGVPYTALRPPAVIGPGDTVITGGFVQALRGEGLPLVPGAKPSRRVSLALVEGVVELACRALAKGPLHGAVHAVDLELSLEELAQLYGQALSCEPRFVSVPWSTAIRRREDAGFSWLVASARFGQHYSAERVRREFGVVSTVSAREAVSAAVSSLQGLRPGLS